MCGRNALAELKHRNSDVNTQDIVLTAQPDHASLAYLGGGGEGGGLQPTMQQFVPVTVQAELLNAVTERCADGARREMWCIVPWMRTWRWTWRRRTATKQAASQ